ncbi:MAG TPA: DUF4215 domain-containing protein [bacterium]|nr:DUF4215 domain-containing protein [bacterium]
MKKSVVLGFALALVLGAFGSARAAGLTSLRPSSDWLWRPGIKRPTEALPPLHCGNGRVERVEECDDGNLANDDGCNSTCKLECGDGIKGAREECEDGNRVSGDGCSSNCTTECSARNASASQGLLTILPDPFCCSLEVIAPLPLVPLTESPERLGESPTPTPPQEDRRPACLKEHSDILNRLNAWMDQLRSVCPARERPDLLVPSGDPLKDLQAAADYFKAAQSAVLQDMQRTCTSSGGGCPSCPVCPACPGCPLCSDSTSGGATSTGISPVIEQEAPPSPSSP